MYVSVVVRSTVTGPDSNRVLNASTLKYHAKDKHDTPACHFILILGQPALLYPLNGVSLDSFPLIIKINAPGYMTNFCRFQLCI